LGEWIEEGLYYSGPHAPAPQGKEWKPADWVELPHENYIPVAKVRLNQVLCAQPRAREAGVELEHFLKLVDGLFHFHHHETLNQLKQDYLLFSPDGGEAAREGMSDHELAARERRFLGNFLRTMVLGNFMPFSEDDYRRAVEQTYLLDVPVEIDWRKHDPEMLESFIRHVDDGGEGGRELKQELGVDGMRSFLALPQAVGTNALVFYRGLDRDQTEGRFLPQRLDLVLSKLLGVIGYPVVKPIQLVLEARQRRRDLTNVAAGQPAPAAETPAAQPTSVFEKRWVRRKNLHNQGLLTRFFQVQQLQEPVLRQVVILFRLRPAPGARKGGPTGLPPRRKRAGAGAGAGNGAPPVRPSAPVKKDWTIHLKMFRHIPMADSEIIFPEKNFRMGSFDLAMLIIGVLIAVPAVVRVITHGGGASIGLLVGVCVLIGKTVARYLQTRSKYISKLTQNLYEKNLDNSMGVLQFLVDSLEEQEYKEAVLVYFVLWTEDRALTERELDGAVEHFIEQHFDGLEVDFEIDDALRKVVDLGKDTPPHAVPIVEVVPGEPRQYRAKPLREALRLLDEKWDNLLRYQ